MSNKLERYLERAAGDLPAIPVIAEQVVKAVENPNSSIDDIRQLIEKDSAIAARILKIANSALYGFPSEIESLGHAISLLGTMTVRNLVLAASMKQTFKRFGLMEKLMWQHSSLSGPVASCLAAHPGVTVNKDVAFTAGLMHHVGKTALANSHRDEYEKVMARVYNEKIGFVEAEREHFGFDHTELGAAVAERWSLPPLLIAVIRNHHDFGNLAELDEEAARLTAVTAVTSLCLTRLGVGRSGPMESLDVVSQPPWAFLDFTEDDLDPILELCQQKIKDSQAIVG